MDKAVLGTNPAMDQLRQLQATDLIPSGSAAQTCHFHAANQHQRQHRAGNERKDHHSTTPHIDNSPSLQ